MNTNRNTVTLSLMSASILLLLVLQVSWLRNSYEKAYYDLRRDADFVFHNSLFSIRDSLFLKSIKPISSDSLPSITNVQSVRVIKRSPHDSVNVSWKTSNLEVFVNSKGDNDSIIKTLQPLARHFSHSSLDGKSFVIRLSDDSIRTDTLKIVFAKALQLAGLPSSFLLKVETDPIEKRSRTRIELPPREQKENQNLTKVYSDTLSLSPVRLNPLNRYSASMVSFRGYIIKQITPQILFSLLLTIITIGAFAVLYRTLRTQQRLMELKNDFISNVTHELKTPVATVSVALEALKNFHAMNDPARTKEYLDIAQNELNRLTLMTDKILKASSFENKGVAIQKEIVDLDSIISQIIESMKLVFEKNGATVSYSKEGNQFSIEGSQAHLINVIYNLVDNALKYSPNQPKLNLTLVEKEDHLVLSIQDNGLGIPSEYKKKIFEKFFRVPTGDIHNIKGYGLGLSYVASVVKEHRGSIDVVSEPGKGSFFNIHLPKK